MIATAGGWRTTYPEEDMALEDTARGPVTDYFGAIRLDAPDPGTEPDEPTTEGDGGTEDDAGQGTGATPVISDGAIVERPAADQGTDDGGARTFRGYL